MKRMSAAMDIIGSPSVRKCSRGRRTRRVKHSPATPPCTEAVDTLKDIPVHVRRVLFPPPIATAVTKPTRLRKIIQALPLDAPCGPSDQHEFLRPRAPCMALLSRLLCNLVVKYVFYADLMFKHKTGEEKFPMPPGNDQTDLFMSIQLVEQTMVIMCHVMMDSAKPLCIADMMHMGLLVYRVLHVNHVSTEQVEEASNVFSRLTSEQLLTACGTPIGSLPDDITQLEIDAAFYVIRYSPPSTANLLSYMVYLQHSYNRLLLEHERKLANGQWDQFSLDERLGWGRDRYDHLFGYDRFTRDPFAEEDTNAISAAFRDTLLELGRQAYVSHRVETYRTTQFVHDHMPDVDWTLFEMIYVSATLPPNEFVKGDWRSRTQGTDMHLTETQLWLSQILDDVRHQAAGFVFTMRNGPQLVDTWRAACDHVGLREDCRRIQRVIDISFPMLVGTPTASP